MGVVVEAIIPISRNKLGDALPVGTRGKVTSHCDDGRAWVFFDGYDEGHTFHEIEKYLRVVQLPKGVTEHQPAARGGGEEWRYREGSGVIYDAATAPTKIIARYVDADVAQQIIIAHDLYQPMLDALKEVEAMLDKELARDYESHSWAKKVRAALMTIEQRSTSE